MAEGGVSEDPECSSREAVPEDPKCSSRETVTRCYFFRTVILYLGQWKKGEQKRMVKFHVVKYKV